jgi:transcriptional regulator with XRE-family HTH domain
LHIRAGLAANVAETASVRATDARDRDIGRRVRVQRLAKGMSQTELGVTFQQIQKYECGGNRIGSGRLQRIAEVLDMPVGFFFSEQSPEPGESPLDYLKLEGAVTLANDILK